MRGGEEVGALRLHATCGRVGRPRCVTETRHRAGLLGRGRLEPDGGLSSSLLVHGGLVLGHRFGDNLGGPVEETQTPVSQEVTCQRR